MDTYWILPTVEVYRCFVKYKSPRTRPLCLLASFIYSFTFSIRKNKILLYSIAEYLETMVLQLLFTVYHVLMTLSKLVVFLLLGGEGEIVSRLSSDEWVVLQENWLIDWIFLVITIFYKPKSFRIRIPHNSRSTRYFWNVVHMIKQKKS